MRKIYSILFVICVLFALTPVSSAATIQVPQQFSTVQAAINAAANGDIIMIAPGTYNGALTLNKGVTLQGSVYDAADPRNNTVIINGNGADAGVITIPAGVTTHPKIIGLTLRNAASGVLSNSVFTMEYTYLTDGDDLAEYERGSGGINRFNVYVGAGDDAIDLDNQSANVTIENNRLLFSEQDGIEIRLQDDDLSNIVDIVIRNNWIEGSGAGGAGDGIQFIDYDEDTNRRYTIERNMIINSRQAGLGLMCCEVTDQNFEAASIREEIRVINNTFIGNNHGITGGDNMLVLNNIFMNTQAIALKNVDGSSRLSNNLFWNNGTNFTGTTVTNPILANPNLDSTYTPQSGSPAINAGLASYNWTNIFGQAVTISIPASQYTGSAPDIGWKESGATGPTPTPSVGEPTISPTGGTTNACNVLATLACFEHWRKEFFKTLTTLFADFNQDQRVDIVDFEIWRKAYAG